MEDRIRELRRRFPKWAHLTDRQLLIAEALYRAVRAKFKLDEVDCELAGRTQNTEVVAP